MKKAPWKLLAGWLLYLTLTLCSAAAAEPLAVASQFEGASVSGVEVDNGTRTIKLMPGGDPVRGCRVEWRFDGNAET